MRPLGVANAVSGESSALSVTVAGVIDDKTSQRWTNLTGPFRIRWICDGGQIPFSASLAYHPGADGQAPRANLATAWPAQPGCCGVWGTGEVRSLLGLSRLVTRREREQKEGGWNGGHRPSSWENELAGHRVDTAHLTIQVIARIAETETNSIRPDSTTGVLVDDQERTEGSSGMLHPATGHSL